MTLVEAVRLIRGTFHRRELLTTRSIIKFEIGLHREITNGTFWVAVIWTWYYKIVRLARPSIQNCDLEGITNLWSIRRAVGLAWQTYGEEEGSLWCLWPSVQSCILYRTRTERGRHRSDARDERRCSIILMMTRSPLGRGCLLGLSCNVLFLQARMHFLHNRFMHVLHLLIYLALW